MLFEYKIVNSSLYITFLNKVIEYNNSNTNLQNNIQNAIKLYYPILANDNITTYKKFLQKKPDFMKHYNTFITSNLFNSRNDVIDTLHNVHYNSTTKIGAVASEGILNINFNIHSKINLSLSLESIFKLINSSNTIPFIKYNPGRNIENMYRLYSNKITKNNKKIPLLNKSHILKYITAIGKTNTVALVIIDNNLSHFKEYLKTREIYLEINNLGIINIKASFNKSISISKCNKLLDNLINPILQEINKHIFTTNSITLFSSIYESNIELVNLDYNLYIRDEYNNMSNFTNIKNCLFYIFNIINDKSVNVKEYKYKRVSNYNETDDKTAFIIELIKQKLVPREIVQQFKNNFNIETLDEAKEFFEKTIQSLNMVHNLFNYNKLKIKNNPGFKIIIEKNDSIKITTLGLDNIKYIQQLKLYFDSLFKIANNTIALNYILPDIDYSICKRSRQGLARANVSENYMKDIDEADTDLNKINKKDIFSDEINLDDDDNDLLSLKGSNDDDDDDDDDDDGDNLLDILLYSDDDDENDDDEKDVDVAKDVAKDVDSIDKVNDDDVKSKSSDVSDFSIEIDDDDINDSDDDVEHNLNDEEIKANTKTETDPNKFDKNIYDDDNELNKDLFQDDNANADTNADINAKTNANSKRDLRSGPIMQRLEKYEKNLFTKTENKSKILTGKDAGPYKNYSRLCQSQNQPVILTDDEKNELDTSHPKSYTYSMQYTSKLGKKHHYICPKFWDLKKNMPLTKKQVESGEHGEIYETKNKNNGNIISFVKKDDYDVIKKPGFLSKEDVCLPCCFAKFGKNTQIKHDKCLNKSKISKNKKTTGPISERSEKSEDSDSDQDLDYGSTSEDANTDDEGIHTNKIYILNPNKFPLSKNKTGSLPSIVKRFLQFDSDACKISSNNNYLAPGKRCLLRYGVRNNENQSFLECILDVYCKNILKIKKNITLIDFKQRVIKAVSLDKYIAYNNGNLVTIFLSKDIDQEFLDLIKMDKLSDEYKKSNLYKNIAPDNINQVNMFKKTLNSYENFKKYLQSEKYVIDHIYMWDIICKPNKDIFPEGLNLILLDITSEDKTENVKVICPRTNYSNEIIDDNKKNLIILKNFNYYEPIYGVKESIDNKFVTVFTFDYNSDEINLIEFKKVLNVIKDNINKKCLSDNEEQFDFMQNSDLKKIINIVTAQPHKYEIIYQIINFENKIIGIVVQGENVENYKYIPCYPSEYDDETIPIKFMNDYFIDNTGSEDVTYYSSYYETKEFLNKLYTESNERIIVKPKFKIIDNNVLIGILTNGNQFVSIQPPEAYNIDSDLAQDTELEEMHDYNYLIQDMNLQTNLEKDTERIEMINNIKLENNFYKTFKNTIINLINNPRYIANKINIKDLINNNTILYYDKIISIFGELKKIGEQTIAFSNYDKQTLQSIKQMSMCSNSNCNAEYCKLEEIDANTICKLVIPDKNLLNEENDNETIYYNKLADEFIRYTNTKKFLFENTQYLLTNNIKYNINQHELVIYESSIIDELFNKNLYIKNNAENYNVYDMFFAENKNFINPINTEYMKYDDSKIKLNTIQSSDKIKISIPKLQFSKIKNTAQLYKAKTDKLQFIKEGETEEKAVVKEEEEEEEQEEAPIQKEEEEAVVKEEEEQEEAPIQKEEEEEEEAPIQEADNEEAPIQELDFENYADNTVSGCKITKKNRIREQFRENFTDTIYETFYHFDAKDTPLCSFQLILSIIKHCYKHKEPNYANLTINDLQNDLIKLYIDYEYNVELLSLIYQYSKNKSMESYMQNIGKASVTTRNEILKQNTTSIIRDTNYYITYLDLYMLSKHYKLPIVLITNSVLNAPFFNNKFLITNINELNNLYYFIKIPSEFLRGTKNYKLLHMENSITIDIGSQVINTDGNSLQSDIQNNLKLYTDIVHAKLDEIHKQNIGSKFKLKRNKTSKSIKQ